MECARGRAEPAPKPVLKPAAPAKPAVAAPKPVVPPPRYESVIPAEKDLSSKNPRTAGPVKDQIWLMVSDPFWLHACWELSLQAVQRAVRIDG